MPADTGVENVGARGLDPLGKPIDLLAGCTSFDEVQRRDSVDNDEVVAGGASRASDEFHREPMAVLLRSAPLIGTVVGSQHRELINEITFRPHDLNAIEPGLLCEQRAAHVIRDRLFNLCPSHRARGKPIDAGRDVGRTDAVLLLGISARMQHLHADFATVLMHSIGDAAKFTSLCTFGQNRPPRLDQTRGVGRITTGDDESDLPLGALGKENRHLVHAVLLHIEPGVHRAHDHAVSQRGSPDLQRR